MNLHLGRLFGIDVKIHWSFWLLPLLIIFSGNAGPLSVGMHLGLLFAMFACVVMHEYGHALTARRYGIRTRDVTLYPIGGVANLERISEKPREELVIAIAGPLVNVVIVAVLIGVVYLKSMFDPMMMHDDGRVIFDSADLFLVLLTWLNVGMILFNMIPAFPLDGGRVLRALLAFKMNRLRATRLAVRIGTVLIFSLAFVSFFFTQSIWLGVIAMFLYFAGQREVAMLEYRDWLRRQAEQQSSWQSMFENMFRRSETDDEPRDDGADDTFVWDPRSQVWVRRDSHDPGRHVV